MSGAKRLAEADIAKGKSYEEAMSPESLRSEDGTNDGEVDE